MVRKLSVILISGMFFVTYIVKFTHVNYVQNTGGNKRQKSTLNTTENIVQDFENNALRKYENISTRTSENIAPGKIGNSAPHVTHESQSQNNLPSSGDIIQHRIISENIASRTSENIILTVFCTTRKDPQRKRLMPPSIHYMNNFYVSAKYLGLNVIIFYDDLEDEFVNTYTTDRITFHKIPMDETLSINDYRFFIFHDWLNRHDEYKRILIADIADISFWGDPFGYMAQHSEHKLFLSKAWKNLR